MNSLKSVKVAHFPFPIVFISQGREFQMAGPKYLIEFCPKYSVLIFGYTEIRFDRNCVGFIAYNKEALKNFRRETMFKFKRFYR